MLAPTPLTILLTIVYFNLSNGFNNLPSVGSKPFVRIVSSRIVTFSSDDKTTKEPDAPDSLDFDSATQALRDEEDAERAERSGNAVSEEQVANFESKKAAYDDMRSKIRDRASSLGVEKSVTTAAAIAEATARARAGENKSPQLDLSKVTVGFDSGDEDELTEEEMMEIDKVGYLPLWEQAVYEFNNTQWPTVGATLRQAGFMLIIFALTATYILYLDQFLREFITNAGLIPRSDEVFDFSDLALPDKWNEFMNEDDLIQ
mmetsp:Transcript_13965/g.17589  ORF Transcript_13965/g.17589 Transcript_13965/m.17589 type:complete len:260 (+) Transcript_13965:146-925(+)|eukprot:CAMPEP_0172510338 /NCGR_PEP_ID=MMETSP1066-20121228/227783_1 /TAXON_ID=671091 /ORGANISM="Coscinodiscus wailesii, Strain CCMP2513" /LENGTH=259 /DNA_ID=CAMNT_0013289251 /DNA_START=147 /DNA_END=926 /DNA_ORIENTATION=+